MSIEKIYLDMDGVIADFNGHFESLYGQSPNNYDFNHGQVRFWEKVYENPNFFSTIPPTEDFKEILVQCRRLTDNIVILSSPSRTNQPLNMIQKRQWVDRHLGENFPAIFDNDKHKYAFSEGLLIDDTPNKVIKWKGNGGLVHLYQGIEKLRDYVKANSECRARQCSDQWVCDHCERRWDMNDPDIDCPMR